MIPDVLSPSVLCIPSQESQDKIPEGAKAFLVTLFCRRKFGKASIDGWDPWSVQADRIVRGLLWKVWGHLYRMPLEVLAHCGTSPKPAPTVAGH